MALTGVSTAGECAIGDGFNERVVAEATRREVTRDTGGGVDVARPVRVQHLMHVCIRCIKLWMHKCTLTLMLPKCSAMHSRSLQAGGNSAGSS